jgi:catechol 2,3-dioxygenase-like lactoylglutathione lyase family enzyme
MTNAEISRRLRISLDAVKFHVANAVAKLSLRNRTALKHWSGAPADGALTRKSRTTNGTGTHVALGAIGQISRQVRDIPSAVVWFRDVLGLRHLYTFGTLAFFDCEGLRLYLNRVEEDAELHDSVIYFRVIDIHAEYERLHQAGVVFRGAPHMIHRHEDGTEEWMAFFEDVDGQLLALMAQVVPQGR